MNRLLALSVLVSLSVPAVLAQPSGLVGTWDIERLTDPNAEPAPDGSLSALIPDNPYTLAPNRLRLAASGSAAVTMVVARQDGYEVIDVPSTYRAEGDRLVLVLDEVDMEWRMEQQGDALVLTASDGSALALRRAPGGRSAD